MRPLPARDDDIHDDFRAMLLHDPREAQATLLHDPPEAPVATAKASRATRQTLVWLRHWTPSLLSIRVTRDPAFRFLPGHYARLGLPDGAGSPVFRPLSIASSPADAHLEFFCTLVPGGAFSTCFAACRLGAPVEVEKAAYGFLTLGGLAPGRDLWLLATGTGLAPYLSILRDPGAWRTFERIVVVHSVRKACELAYADELASFAHGGSPGHGARLIHIPVVTREPGAARFAERIPALVADGRLARAAGVHLDPAHSRVMVCGHPDMTRELRHLLGERGFRTTRRGVPGQVAFEKYW